MPKKVRNARVDFHKIELFVFRFICLICFILAGLKIIKAELKGLFEPPSPPAVQTSSQQP